MIQGWSQAMQKEFIGRGGAKPAPASEALARTRAALIKEEWTELIQAVTAGDAALTADAFADLKYVVLGAAEALGAEIPDSFVDPGPPDWPPASSALKAFLVVAEPLVAEAIEAVLFGWRSSDWLSKQLTTLDGALAVQAAAWGFPLEALYKEVHRSNMTKSPNQDGGVSKYGPGGKGLGYAPPDISGVLKSAGWKLE